MNISCIILNYNDYETTIQQIERIKDYKCFDSIIVVDNNSDDGSVSKLKEHVKKNIVLLSTDHNGGYGAGNNLGVRYAYEVLHATHALIANPDTVFSSKCVKAMAAVMKNHPEAGVIAPVMKQETDSTQAIAWPHRSWAHELMETGPICRRVFKKLLNYPEGYLDKASRNAVYVGAVPGSLIMVDAQKMMECGGYDEEVFLYGEENILGYNMRSLGYKTVLLLTQSYEHRHSVSINKTYQSMAEKQKLRHKSTLQYFRYYLGINAAQEIITRIFFANIMAEIWFCNKVLKMKW